MRKVWTRSELKRRAKEVLKKNYWKAFLISLVIALAQGSSGGSSQGGEGSASPNQAVSDFVLANLIVIIIAGIGIIILSIALRVFLGYPLEVGGRKYFVQSAQGRDNKGCFKFAFRKENYTGIIMTMLRRSIQNILWFLLLIIPGLIKYYSYSMVPYILADNPNVGSKRAIEISRKITEGHKLNMFVLDLSFLGWYILGLLALFVGVLFVLPYYNATYSELYLVLRQRAIDTGLCSIDDFQISI